MNAIQAAKNKSLWTDDLKLRVEAVLGATVSLYSRRNSETLEDSIFWGGHDPRTRLWSVFGTTGITDMNARGELFVGGVLNPPYVGDFIPGIIMINLGSSQSAGMLDQIKLAINQDGGYVGHSIYLGYLSGTVFIVEAQA